MDEKTKIFLPDGRKRSVEDDENITERAQKRAREDEHYTPVIVKRTDEAFRHPDDILENAIEAGLEQLQRPFISLVLSSIAAGLILGFSVMAVAVVTTLSLPQAGPLLHRLLSAAVYPLGFVICIMSGTELFTEHTATAVYPVLDKKAGPLLLGRLWLTVLAGNLFGCLLGACLLVQAETVIGAREGYLAIAAHLLEFSSMPVFISALLAGWLMAQGAWLILTTHSTIGQITCIYIVTFVIGLGALHHSIAGSVEIFTALLINTDMSFFAAGRFLALTILGNLAGGSIFVALLNYGHIRKTQTVSDKVKEG